jgi:putative DNA primase/helicase
MTKNVKRTAGTVSPPKPILRIDQGDLTATARRVGELISASPNLFYRGTVVRVVPNGSQGELIVAPLTAEGVIHETHKVCTPKKLNDSGRWVRSTLPMSVAKLVLDIAGTLNIRPLNGITNTPILSAKGDIRFEAGYDIGTGLLCNYTNELSIKPICATVTLEAAMLGFQRLRETFRTFPFRDSPRVWDRELQVAVVDVRQLPGFDESTFLMALLTAVCRSSLWLSPGALIVAPAISGAGTGKGLLSRAMSLIAFGTLPYAFTMGHDPAELDKRIVAELIGASHVLFLDNVNGKALKSDTLASAITERPARVRELGKSRMLLLNSTAFIVITGNGLSVTEDLARRFIAIFLDAQMEDAEQRPFASGFLDSIHARRCELLADLLTIWRYGRQNKNSLKRGKSLGSFEIWCEWVRDPLLSLGCSDPVDRITATKAKDADRLRIVDIFNAWHQRHGEHPMKASELHPEVNTLIDQQQRGRQFVVSELNQLVGTQLNGWMLTESKGAGKWSVTTYALRRVSVENA